MSGSHLSGAIFSSEKARPGTHSEGNCMHMHKHTPKRGHKCVVQRVLACVRCVHVCVHECIRAYVKQHVRV